MFRLPHLYLKLESIFMELSQHESERGTQNTKKITSFKEIFVIELPIIILCYEKQDMLYYSVVA